MLGSAYTTRFLADSIRGRQLVTLERTVQLMTDIPARVFGLRDRGRVEAGYHADLVVFDPETVDATPAQIAYDLPGNAKRLLAKSVGIERVFVNGHLSVVDGVPIGVTAGRVMRSGRDTTGRD
jgi:N-acyl-D-aspartate/D-glutamate deacylase